MSGWTPSDDMRRQEGEDIPHVPPGGRRRRVSEPTASDLAADVLAGAHFYMAHRGKESPHPADPEVTVWEHTIHDHECHGCKAIAALDALVARLRHAETRVDTLTREKEWWTAVNAELLPYQERALAAEAALADTRRALEAISVLSDANRDMARGYARRALAAGDKP